jgi:hypothetical protein
MHTVAIVRVRGGDEFSGPAAELLAAA